jgi:hypothetical protein
MLRLLRSRAVRGVLALTALSVPAGVATAGSTEPDDSSPDSAAPEDTSVTNTDGDAPAPPNGTAPESSTAEGDGGITAPSADEIQFEIDMMLGLVPQEEMEQHWAEQEEEQQLAVQACMNESGFDYEIENYPVMMGGPGGLEWGTLEFAEQYGFGIWTTMDPESSGMDMAMEYTSPNDAIVNALTPEEQNAWYEVQMRCQNESYAGQDDMYRNPDVQQIMEDFYSDVENDPRTRDAQAGWVDCMEAAGFPYPSQEEMYEDVSAGDDESYELHNQFYESEAWLESSEDHAQWQALVDHEIEVAVANAGCEPAITETREEVQRDLRDDLIAVWQTIDWSQPPVTYEGEGDVFLMPGESLPVGSDVPEGSADATTEAGTTPEGSEEPQVGLDLGDPTETTEA